MFAVVFLISFLSVKSSGAMDKQTVAIISDIDAVNQVFKDANQNDTKSTGLMVYGQTSNKDVEYIFLSNEDNAKQKLKNQKNSCLYCH